MKLLFPPRVPEVRTEYLLLISCFCAKSEHLQVLYQSLICTTDLWRHSLRGICFVKAVKTMQVEANITNPYGKVTCPQCPTYCNYLGTAGNLSAPPGDHLQIRPLSSQTKCHDQADIIIPKCDFHRQNEFSVRYNL